MLFWKKRFGLWLFLLKFYFFNMFTDSCWKHELEFLSILVKTKKTFTTSSKRIQRLFSGCSTFIFSQSFFQNKFFVYYIIVSYTSDLELKIRVGEMKPYFQSTRQCIQFLTNWNFIKLLIELWGLLNKAVGAEFLLKAILFTAPNPKHKFFDWP